MVSFDERAWYLLLGVIIGYVIRILQEIIARKRKGGKHSEGGFMRYPVVADVALLSVVVVTVWAAFSSAQASNELEKTQNRLEQITVCNQRFLSDTISALNSRTTYTRQQIIANQNLQRAQSKFLGIFFVEPPATEEQRHAQFVEYFDALQNFNQASDNTTRSYTENPYPTSAQLAMCLGNAKENSNG